MSSVYAINDSQPDFSNDEIAAAVQDFGRANEIARRLSTNPNLSMTNHQKAVFETKSLIPNAFDVVQSALQEDLRIIVPAHSRLEYIQSFLNGTSAPKFHADFMTPRVSGHKQSVVSSWQGLMQTAAQSSRKLRDWETELGYLSHFVLERKAGHLQSEIDALRQELSIRLTGMIESTVLGFWRRDMHQRTDGLGRLDRACDEELSKFKHVLSTLVLGTQRAALQNWARSAPSGKPVSEELAVVWAAAQQWYEAPEDASQVISDTLQGASESEFREGVGLPENESFW